MSNETFTPPALPSYTPYELEAVTLNRFQALKDLGLVCVRGIYNKCGRNANYAYAFDKLLDEHQDKELTLMVRDEIRDLITDGALVQLVGTVEAYVTKYARSTIAYRINVSRCLTLQERPVSPDDLRRADICRAKAEAGYKPVEADLAQRLLRGETPRVAMLYAQSSITAADFAAGAAAASTQFVFDEHRVSFADSKALAAMLRQLDAQDYHALALIRGGGTGLDALDAPDVLEVAAHMHTPLIAAVGHAADRLLLKNLADKVVATPTDLGHFFAALVEHAAEVRTRSRAALVEDVRKQYAQQLAEADKKNAELLKRIDSLTRAQQETAKQFAAQRQALEAQRPAQPSRAPYVLLIILALAAGILIGWLLLH